VAEEKRGVSDAEQKWPKVKPHRLRIRIVAACHLREVTPRQIAVEERLHPSTVRHYFKGLEREGWIHVCRREPVGNCIRHWYTADRPKVIGDREFEDMNEQERNETSEGVLMHYLDICKLALKTGTLDARADSHLSHTLVYLDRDTWKDVQKELSLCLERTLEKTAKAEARLLESGEDPIPTVIHFGGFEVPRSVMEDIKVPQK
jgi:hypothetical protein